MRTPRIQEYPRKNDLLDASTLKPHHKQVDADTLREIVLKAIQQANRKSSRAILEISDGLDDKAITAKYQKSGKELFDYFVKYCGDPAATAHQCYQRHYSEVAQEQFRNRTLQKERMNSGWRYQYIAKDTARVTERFHDISDVNQIEADFNVSIDYAAQPAPVDDLRIRQEPHKHNGRSGLAESHHRA